jgi:hypothetical protein
MGDRGRARTPPRPVQEISQGERHMRPSHLAGVLAAVPFVAGVPMAAQQTREALIRQERNEPDPATRQELLMRAADPGLGARDSLWAVGVLDLAQSLLMSRQEEAGKLWLRWLVRHGSRWRIDRSYYDPTTILAYDQAVPKVRSEEVADSIPVETSWRWPGTFARTGRGSVEVRSADPSVPVTVTVEGGPTVLADSAVGLQAGTYDLTAGAPGFVTAHLTREVLPGATTVLEFDLPPVLPSAATGRVTPALVTIRYTEGGRSLCANGLMARAGGLVLTTSGLQQDRDLQVETSAGVYRQVSVAATDPAHGLAVLRLEAGRQPALQPATRITDGEYAWSFFRTGCGTPTRARTRLSGWDGSRVHPVDIEPELPLAASGSALFDGQGELIGVVTGPGQVAPIGMAQALLDRATGRATTAERPAPHVQVAPRGRGLPWMWIGAGAAVVGVAAAVIVDGLGGGSPDHPTGGIKVTFPGGVSP